MLCSHTPELEELWWSLCHQPSFLQCPCPSQLSPSLNTKRTPSLCMFTFGSMTNNTWLMPNRNLKGLARLFLLSKTCFYQLREESKTREKSLMKDRVVPSLHCRFPESQYIEWKCVFQTQLFSRNLLLDRCSSNHSGMLSNLSLSFFWPDAHLSCLCFLTSAPLHLQQTFPPLYLLQWNYHCGPPEQ